MCIAQPTRSFRLIVVCLCLDGLLEFLDRVGDESNARNGAEAAQNDIPPFKSLFDPSKTGNGPDPRQRTSKATHFDGATASREPNLPQRRVIDLTRGSQQLIVEAEHVLDEVEVCGP